MLLRHQRIKLLILATIILFCYSLSAIFQEKVLRRPYGEGEGERFTFAFAFTAVQCVVYASVAKAVITVRGEKKNETPQRFFCIIGVFYVLAKVTSYMSLRYVPYPTSVVGKSAKPIPVMLLGVLIGRKTYTMYKYIFVSIVVIGVGLFTFKEKYDKKDGEDPILGIVFIGISLLMDGFLGAFEDRMRSVKKPTPLNLMMYMNSWNTLYLTAYLVTTSEGVEFFKFCYRHPVVVRDLSVVVFFGIFGQFCITSMIAYYGALPLSITTTIRKFVTVLLSVMIFNNVLSVRQWIAASIIFIALFLDGQFSRKKKKNSKPKNEGVDDGKECVENHIENGGEIVKREEDIEKGAIENQEKCEKINSLQNKPTRPRTIRVSFEGDMLDMLDEINYGFEDSDEDSLANKDEASKDHKSDNQEIGKNHEPNNEEKVCNDDKALVDPTISTAKLNDSSESGDPTSNNDKLIPKAIEVLSQENSTQSDQITNGIEKSRLYPELEKEITETDSNSQTITNKMDIDPAVQDKIDKTDLHTENIKNNTNEIVCDLSDDTKL